MPWLALAASALVLALSVVLFVVLPRTHPAQGRCALDPALRTRAGTEWIAVHDAVCARTTDAAIRDRALDCLDRVLEDRALLDRTGLAAAAIAVLAPALAPPSSCADPAQPAEDPARLRRWLELATALDRNSTGTTTLAADAIAALGDDPAKLTALAELALLTAHWPDAHALFAHLAAIPSRTDVEVATALTRDAVALAHQNRSHEALDTLRRALPLAERALGPDHLETALAAANLGALLAAGGEHAQALRMYDRALPAIESALGARSQRAGEALLGLARAHRGLHETEAALGDLHRAVTLFESAGPAAREDLALARYALGDLQLELDRPEDAARALEDARAILEEGDGPKDPALTADVLADLGIAAALRGDRATALASLERALSILESTARGSRTQNAGLARVRFALARALAVVPADRDRAVTLARTARFELGDAAAHAAEREAIDAWLDNTGRR